MDNDATEKVFVKKGRRAGVRRGPRSAIANLGSTVVDGVAVPMGGSESRRQVDAESQKKAETLIERVFEAIGGEDAIVANFKALPPGSKELTQFHLRYMEFDAERRRQLMKDLPDDGTDVEARVQALAGSLAGGEAPILQGSPEDLVGEPSVSDEG